MIASIFHLSRTELAKIRKRNKYVFDDYTVHKLIYSLFPKKGDESRSFLFSDEGYDAFWGKRFLIVSEDQPEIPEVGSIESKQIPQSFLEQDCYGFTVQVNPVKRDIKTRSIIPIKGRDELCDWFYQKANSYGFEIEQDSLSVGDTSVMQFIKDGQKMTFGKAVFTGRLHVTDRQLFIKSFRNGIGKSKAFGFGLLKIIPLSK